ncbi:MAG: AAA family ATPase [Spirochaetaceae bacterium]|nr:AAA family ATPase [Spirochaetaceae bacterium]
MFLKTLDLIGFKSFADKTHLDFSDGITSLLGPNGCGKSNIVDAIKWVLGEQSTKTLRAGKMEDVIFNGTDTRKPLQMAEVTLVINNEEHQLNMETSEIEIKRRIFRSGESEYYLNRNRVLLKNIRELFFDTGVGKSAYSILEQGKIDQILSTRPEDRRYIFEEAAGISRFKVQSKEAERKLKKTDENIVQVDNILREVKRTYETKKNQAEKCIKYNELNKEKFNLEVDVQLSTIQSYLMLRDSSDEKLKNLEQELINKQSSMSGLDTGIEDMKSELQHLVSRRIEIQTELKRLEEEHKGKHEFLSLLSQHYRDALLNKTASLEKAEAIKAKIENNEREIEESEDKIENLKVQYSDVGVDVVKNEELLKKAQLLIVSQNKDIATLENKIDENELSYTELSQELKDITDFIVEELEDKLGKSGYNIKTRVDIKNEIDSTITHILQSLESQKTLLIRLSSLDSKSLIKKIEEDKSVNIANVKRLEELLKKYDLVIPTFIDDFIKTDGLVSRKRTMDEKIRNNRKDISIARNQISYLRGGNEKLAGQCEEFRENIYDLKVTLEQIQGMINEQKVAISTIKRQKGETQLEYSDRIAESHMAEEKANDVQSKIIVTQDEMEAIAQSGMALSEELGEKITLIEAQSDELNMKQNQKTDSFNTLNNLRRSKDQLEVQIEGINQAVTNIYTTFFENYGKSLQEYEDRLKEDLGETKILRNQLEECNKSLSHLGYINQMAEDEFNEAKQQYDFLNEQINDLLKAKTDLEEIVKTITTESEIKFLDTYKRISENFQNMFRRLFGGGRAELKLSDPENILESGIEIFAQPPGKKLTTLSLLSGGERSMTAVGLLFATYEVKPSPFCILDEIDAALDDRNIGFFLSVLEDFSQDSQFIIITHNKHTVIGSRTLLGVTQIEAGVSTTVSYKIGLEQGSPVILTKDDKEVKLD